MRTALGRKPVRARLYIPQAERRPTKADVRHPAARLDGAVSPTGRFDVAVVGASVAGCTAARLFAQSGARVALIEQRNDPAAYKVVCTHAILTPSTPTIERLGLAPMLTERGVPRTWAEFWTPSGGWFGLPDDMRGWGVTRRTLDPLLRDFTVN